MKLFLLDAYALIYRAYYAFIKNPRYNSKGQNTSAILGFVNTLEDVLKNMQPTHIGVAFDPHGGTFRHKAYPEYKAQREETPEAIRFAVPQIKRILEAYNIPVLEVENYEADDVIGTLAHQADLQGIDTYMMTPDKDYGQLVTDNVKMYKPAVGKQEAQILGPAEVCAKWGIENTHQVIDILGLMGDSVDNIPGCPGVGEKTACSLIQQWGGVEGLISNVDKLKGALQKKVSENVGQIRQSYWLATIVIDAPITLDIKALEYTEPDAEKLEEIYKELEFRQLLKKTQSKKGETSETTRKTNNQTTKKNTDGSVQGDLFAMFDAAENTTTQAHVEQRPVLPSYIIEDGVLIGHDLKSHWKDIKDFDGERFDTEIAHYVLHPEMRHGLEYLQQIYQSETLQDLKAKLEKELNDEGLMKLFQEIEMPLMPVLARMEETGVSIDIMGLAETSRQFTEELNGL